MLVLLHLVPCQLSAPRLRQNWVANVGEKKKETYFTAKVIKLYGGERVFEEKLFELFVDTKFYYYQRMTSTQG